MPKYILAYHRSVAPVSESEKAAVLAAWGAWFGTLGDAVVDPGNPTGASTTLAADGSTSAVGTNPLTGYSLINATDLDAAVSLAKGCPIFARGGTIEVAEAIEM